jgi:glycerophosphoryl diester phosphodiesterase
MNLSGIKGAMRTPVATLSFFLVALAGACAEEQKSAWNLRDHIPLEDVTVQSHRGAGVLSPENSIEAFEIAWKLGTIPEADLRTSKDGVIVAFHDGDFQRILPEASAAERRRGVADLTWDELRRLDIGAWKGPRFAGQRIPRMTDVYGILERHPDLRLYVDIKNVNLKQLADESKAVHSQLILASTNYDLIREWRKLAPESSTLHWMGGTETELANRIAELRKTQFVDITQLQIHVRTGKDGALTPSPAFLVCVGEELRQHDILFQALPWDRKDPEICWRLMDLGVASFATDYPDVVMQAVRDYYQQDRRTKP